MIQVSRYSSINFDNDWKLRFQIQADYCQKFAKTDKPRVQYVLSADSLLKPFIEVNGVVTQQESLTLNQTDDFIVKEVVLNLASIQPGAEVLLFFAENDSSVHELESLFLVTDETDDTVLIEYTNRRNEFDTIFSTNSLFQFRVEGAFLPQDYTFESQSENFRDQRHVAKTLSGYPIEKKTLSLGGGFGVPRWVASLINNIFSLSNVYVNGDRMVRDEGGSVEMTLLHNDYPLYIYKITLEKSDDITADLVALFRAVDSKKKVARSSGEDIRVYNEFAKSLGISDSKMIRELSTIEEISKNFYIEIDDGTSSNTGKTTLALLQKFIFEGWINQPVRTSDDVKFRSVVSNNYKEKNNGWSIDATGISEFANLFLRGVFEVMGDSVFHGDIKSHDYATGALGAGYGLIKDSNGDSYLEVDRLLVRKIAYFVELVIQRMSHVGGQIVLTPASMKCVKVEEYDDYYRCYFESTDGDKTITNDFVVGDQARCQTFNIKTGTSQNVSNSYYWRLVVGVGDDYIDLSKVDCDAGSTVPQADDEIVLLGNRTDATRQAAIVLASYGNDAPYIKLYRGINSYQLSGKEFISFSRSQIKMIADELYFSTGESVSTVINGVKADLAETKTEFQGKIDTVDSKVEGIQVGGRNLIKNSKLDDLTGWNKDANPSGISIVEFDGYKCLKVVAGSDGVYATRYGNLVNSPYSGEMTTSVDVYTTKPLILSIGIEDIGNRISKIDTINQWVRLSTTQNCDGEPHDFIIYCRQNQEHDGIYFKNVKLEVGNKATDWSPAPEDLEAAADAAQKAADAAQAAADAADAKADNAQTAADAAKDRLDDWAADSVISPTEKQGLKDEIARIDGDKSEITANYTKYGLGTPTAYNSAHSAYRAVLVTLSASTPETITIPSDFATKQTAYYTARTNALTAIAEKAKQVADAAQTAADNAQTAADNALDKYNNLKIGMKNLVSFKHMLSWNDKAPNKDIAVWGKDSDGVYLGINGWQLFESVVGGSENLNDIFLGEGNYKANTQYVLSVEWKLAGAQDYQGLMFYIEYTDGSRDFTQIAKDQTTLIRADVVTAKGKTIKKIYSAYGTNTYRTLIYALSLVEGNVIPLEIPTAEEDIWRSEVNLVDGGEEVTLAVITSGEYNYKELIVPVLKPNTVYTVSVENIEVLAGSPVEFAFSLYDTSVKTEYDGVVLTQSSKYGLLITPNNFTAGKAYLLPYAGRWGSTAGNSVRYTGISLVEGFYPPTAWRPSQGDLDKEIQEVSNALTNLDTTINGAFKDGIINEAEAKAIASNINILNAEKKDVDAQYTELYANPYLAGTAKTNLNSAKTAYNTAHTNLINAINTAISDKEVTAAEKSDVDSKFTAYGTALGTYKTRVEEANKAIQDEIKRQADEAAQEKVDEESELAKWRAIGYSWAGGKPLWGYDPTFKEGNNGIGLYDNAQSGSVTITREAKQSDSPVNESDYNLKIVCNGGGSPNEGGFLKPISTRASAVFVFRFIAKLPSNAGFDFNYNSFGDGAAWKWITSRIGTGKFEEYIAVAKCGATGSFSTIGFFSLWGTTPITCYLAYAGAFDVTAGVSQADVVSATVTQLSSQVESDKEHYLSEFQRIDTEVSAIPEATKEQIEDAVVNLRKGMRNLLLQSTDIDGNSYHLGNRKYSKTPIPGQRYTLVICYTLGANNDYIGVYQNYGNYQVKNFSTKGSKVIEKCAFTWSSSAANATVMGFYQFPNGTYGSIVHWACLYEGDIVNNAPDYFVNAPEDLNLEINSVTEWVSAIEQDAESITLRVSATETKVDAAQSTADAAQTAANNASTKADTNLTAAKDYADDKKQEAINTAAADATSKANDVLADAKADATTKANNALASAKTDAQNKADAALSSAKSYADTKDSSTLESAKNYAESEAAGALSDAKDYTDGRTKPMWKGWIDATGLDEDKYYPVTITIPSSRKTTIEVYQSLSYNCKPSWSTHNGGFSLKCIWEVIGSGWGINPNLGRQVLDYSKGFTAEETVTIDDESVTRAVHPVGTISQIGQANMEYIYVRGGGQYYFTVINANESTVPVLHTSDYTWTSGSTSVTLKVLTSAEITPIEITGVTKTEFTAEIEMLEKAINLRVTKTDYNANNVALNQQIGQLETSYNSINGTVSSLNTRLGVLEESGFIVQDDFVTLFSQQLSESGDLIASYLNLTPDKVTLGTDTLEFNADKVKFVSENGLIKLFDGTNVINVNNGKFLVKNTGELNINNGVFKVTNTGALTATNANITGTVTATSGVFAGNIQTLFAKIEDIYTSTYGGKLRYEFDVGQKYVNILCKGNDYILLSCTSLLIGVRMFILDRRPFGTKSGYNPIEIVMYAGETRLLLPRNDNDGMIQYSRMEISYGFVELLAVPDYKDDSKCNWIILNYSGYYVFG